jgi:hypothetical protein
VRFGYKWVNAGRVVSRYALCVVRYALCVVRCALCVVRCALCVVRCALCVMRCALCVVRCALCVVRGTKRGRWQSAMSSNAGDASGVKVLVSASAIIADVLNSVRLIVGEGGRAVGSSLIARSSRTETKDKRVNKQAPRITHNTQRVRTKD